MLINDCDIRIIHATTGEIIRELILNPAVVLPKPGSSQAPNKAELGVQGVAYVLRHHKGAPRGNRTPNPLIKRSQQRWPQRRFCACSRVSGC
jgi:hypothetical protein